MQGNTTVRTKLLARLVTAKTHDKWVPRKDLLRIATRGYLDRLLPELLREGLVTRKGPRGNHQYQGTELATKLLDLGPLPRGTQKRRERTHDVDVTLVPNNQLIDVQNAWMEHVRVSIKVDMHTADLMRAKCVAPGARDRAQQFSFGNKEFSITVSRRGACMLVLKELQWSKSFPDWLQACGLSANTMTNVLGQVTLQLPESFRRIEIPVLQRELKQRNVRFVIRTRAGEDWVESNINYSTDVDLEALGTGILVDNWVAMLAATQHNAVAVLQALEQQIKDLMKKTEELRKEREPKPDTKEGEYYV